MHTDTQTAPAAAAAVDPKRRYLCRHIFTGGHRCASPALRSQKFCYYHDRTRREAPICGRSGTFPMPHIDDRTAVQLALFEVLSRMSAGDIDLKFGTALLYGLQIASSNLPRRATTPAGLEPQVEEIEYDCNLGDLAPIAEVPDLQPSPDAVIPTSAPPPPQREYTEAETVFLRHTTSAMSYDPGNRHRPKSITDDDIVASINTIRSKFCLPTIDKEPGWNAYSLSVFSAERPDDSPLPDEIAAPPPAPVILSLGRHGEPNPHSDQSKDPETLLPTPAGSSTDFDYASPRERADAEDLPNRIHEAMEEARRITAEREMWGTRRGSRG
jgi:hypothetical protein